MFSSNAIFLSHSFDFATIFHRVTVVKLLEFGGHCDLQNTSLALTEEYIV